MERKSILGLQSCRSPQPWPPSFLLLPGAAPLEVSLGSASLPHTTTPTRPPTPPPHLGLLFPGRVCLLDQCQA